MSFLKSPNIRVFPFGSERKVDKFKYDHVLNEQNLTDIIQMLTDNKNYVVSYDYVDNVHKLSFVIQGYYFRTDFTNDDISSGKYIYAQINYATESNNASSDLYRYLGTDNTQDFEGLQIFAETVLGEETETKLYIGEKSPNGALIIPYEAYIRFTKSMKITDWDVIAGPNASFFNSQNN